MCYSDSISSQDAEFSPWRHPIVFLGIRIQRGTRRGTARKVVYTYPPKNHREMLRLVAGQGVVGRLGGATQSATFRARQTAVRCVRFGSSTIARWTT
jgi:hypothetical protein